MQVTITPEGSLPIPPAYLEMVGIRPNTSVECHVEGRRLVVSTVLNTLPSHQARSMIDAMAGKGDVMMTTDEIMHLTRGEA